VADRVAAGMRCAFDAKGVLCIVRDINADNEGFVVED
jgi:hypothetical protein